MVDGKEEALFLVRAGEDDEGSEEEWRDDYQVDGEGFFALGEVGYCFEDGVKRRQDRNEVEVKRSVLPVVAERFDAVELVAGRLRERSAEHRAKRS